MTVATVANQKKVFLDELIVVGDENQTCKELGLDLSQVLEWTQKDDVFRLRIKQVLEHYSKTLATRISVAALNGLYEVLKHGDLSTTNSTTIREVFDLEGNLCQLTNETQATKTNKNPSWAIKQGIQLHILEKLESSISRSLTNLIENNVIPEKLREQILQVIDSNDAMIQNIFGRGSAKEVQISETMLAEIQNILLGS